MTFNLAAFAEKIYATFQIIPDSRNAALSLYRILWLLLFWNRLYNLFNLDYAFSAQGHPSSVMEEKINRLREENDSLIKRVEEEKKVWTQKQNEIILLTEKRTELYNKLSSLQQRESAPLLFNSKRILGFSILSTRELDNAATVKILNFNYKTVCSSK